MLPQLRARVTFSLMRIFIVNIEGYAHLVPFVESEHEVFLKTIIPSRKATRKYLRGESKNG
jgi:hypothetical protein